MKTEIANKKDTIAICAAYLANNIQFVSDDLEPSKEGPFVQSANCILVIILPRFHHGEEITQSIETGSMLAEVALLKLMKIQAQEIINHIRKTDVRFSHWVAGCLMGFIHDAANKYASRQLNLRSGEYLS